MFQIVEPFYLIALSSLLLPVFIHLWNKKQTKTLAFGSIQYLPKQKITYLYQLFFADKLLLLLRILLLSFFIVLLTQLFYKHTNTQDVRTKAVFIASELLPISDYSSMKNCIDSLDTDISTFYYLDNNLSKIADIDSINPLETEKIASNNFELMQHIEHDFASENDVFIFASNQLNAYQGKAPILDKSLIVNVLPSKKTTKYIAKLERKNDKEMIVFFGTSDAEKTSIVKQNIRLNETKQTEKIEDIGTVDFLWQKDKNTLAIHSKDEKIDTIVSLEKLALSQKKYNIQLIYEQKRQADVQYFEAALRTIAKFYDTTIELKKEKLLEFERKVLAQKKKGENSNINEFREVDMYIWLSQKPIIDRLENELEVGKMILADAEKNDFKKVNSLLFRENENGFQTFDYPYLYQISKESTAWPKKENIWTDSFGNEVLSAAILGEKEGVFYQFNSRFHADYTNLVEQVWFPIWLNDLLEKKPLSDKQALLKRDITTITTNLLPLNQSEKSVFKVGEKVKKEISKSLHFPLWLLVIFLFVVERFWSEWKYGKKK
ncbi:MAG: BatA domain-containing protein [Chitinophagales bacterium]